MVGRLILAATAALGLAAGAAALVRQDPPPGAQPGTLAVTWEIATRGNGPGQVHLSLRHRTRGGESHNSSDYPLAALEGLTPGADGPVRFRLAREAGTLDCEGTMRGGRGSGRCTFLPDSGFAAMLERRGIGRAGLQDQYQLALQDVGTPLIEELERQGYSRPSVGELVALGIHGADVDYLRALDSAGYRAGVPERLVSMRIHGVTPEYISGLRQLGPAYADVPAEQLVAMRIHGVSLDFIREMAALGYSGYRPDDLVAMSIHGVDPALARELAGLGYRDLPASSLTSMAIHGVTPDYVRAMAAAGYRNLTVDQLVTMKIHGVTPDDARRANDM